MARYDFLGNDGEAWTRAMQEARALVRAEWSLISLVAALLAERGIVRAMIRCFADQDQFNRFSGSRALAPRLPASFGKL
jgi:hypothetical protein